MRPEQRGWAKRLSSTSNGQQEETLAATKPFDIPKDADRLLGGSGVSREAPAPFCERPEVKLLRPTRHSLHWVLDVVFADDQSRLRKGPGAHNMAVVRHFALNLVRSAPDMPPPARSPLKRGPKPSSKPKAMSLKLRRKMAGKMAGWNSAYMQTVL